MPYNINTNYKDCNGYAVVGPDGDVLGCHPTRDEALGQQAALYATENKVLKESSEIYQLLDDSEKEFHDSLEAIAEKYGKFNTGTPIYVDYVVPLENENISKGIICGHCAFWQEGGVCHIVSGKIQYNGYCRFAAIPSELVKNYKTETEREVEEMDKAEGVRVGQMVSWNSSGGRAEGKVKRILRSGSYNVPNSEFTITGTEDNPAVVIELYTNGKPSGRMVGHRMNTLRVSKSIWGAFDPKEVVTKSEVSLFTKRIGK